MYIYIYIYIYIVFSCCHAPRRATSKGEAIHRSNDGLGRILHDRDHLRQLGAVSETMGFTSNHSGFPAILLHIINPFGPWRVSAMSGDQWHAALSGHGLQQQRHRDLLLALRSGGDLSSGHAPELQWQATGGKL